MGLGFPSGAAMAIRRDVWDRLLVYLWYEGENFNLRTVKDGYSPYFPKYGFSGTHHQEFVAAEAAAKKKGLGIWDTSRASDLRGDYTELRAWWDRRGEILRTFDNQYAQRGDIFAPRRGDYWIMRKNNMGKRITVFTSIRSGKMAGSVFLGKAEGALNQVLFIVGLASKAEIVETLQDSVGEYKYFTGKLIEGIDGKPRLIIRGVGDVSDTPPARQALKSLKK